MATGTVDPLRDPLMRTDGTRARIREFILNQFPLARKRAIGDADALLGTGILDSLGILEVVAFVEREFAITVADEELVPESFESIASIARFVEEKRAHGPGASEGKA
jgi:acyl carrier protein